MREIRIRPGANSIKPFLPKLTELEMTDLPPNFCLNYCNFLVQNCWYKIIKINCSIAPVKANNVLLHLPRGCKGRGVLIEGVTGCIEPQGYSGGDGRGPFKVVNNNKEGGEKRSLWIQLNGRLIRATIVSKAVASRYNKKLLFLKSWFSIVFFLIHVCRQFESIVFQMVAIATAKSLLTQS